MYSLVDSAEIVEQAERQTNYSNARTFEDRPGLSPTAAAPFFGVPASLPGSFAPHRHSRLEVVPVTG